MSHSELDALAADLRPALLDVPECEDAVVDLYAWRPGEPVPDEQAYDDARGVVSRADFPESTKRVLIDINGQCREMGMTDRQQYTFQRHGQAYEEDRLIRGLHPKMAERLDMWRLSNFRTERLPSADDVFLFQVVAHANLSDERLLAIAEVRDLTPVREAAPSLSWSGQNSANLVVGVVRNFTEAFRGHVPRDQPGRPEQEPRLAGRAGVPAMTGSS